MRKKIRTFVVINQAERYSMEKLIIQDKDYVTWITSLCSRYRKSQIKAAVKVNSEKLMFYWSLGKDIVELHAESKWGDGFYKNVCRDLKAALPGANCFSETNVKYMKNFYLLYSRYSSIRPQVGDEFGKCLQPDYARRVHDTVGTPQVAHRQIP